MSKTPISLITVAELSGLLEKDPGSVSLVDTREISEFELGHIPGAIHIAWEEWCAKAPAEAKADLHQPGYWGLLTEMQDDEIASKLTKLGLSNDRTVVVYADGNKSKGREGRISWMLLYFGASDVRILDGGFNSWKANSAAVSVAPDAVPPPGEPFLVRRDENRRIRLQELKSLMSEKPYPLLIDTRSLPEFIGDSYEYMPRTGTLEHACLLPYSKLFNSDGTFLNAENLQKVWPEQAAQAKSIVAFCEVGVRACTVALLHEIYTGEKIPVYDGSMMEWGSDPELPVSRQLDKQK